MLSTATTPHRLSEGTASALRLHEAIRTGQLRLVHNCEESATPDPYLLTRQTPRQAPRRATLHRVDTHADIPDGLDGVAFGDAALGRSHSNAANAANDPEESFTPVDRLLRSRVWRAIVLAYLAAGCLLAWIVFKA